MCARGGVLGNVQKSHPSKPTECNKGSQTYSSGYNICGGCSGDRWAASKPIRDPAGPGHLVGAAGMMGGGGVLGWEVLVGRSD
jgi:hypothetical protein